jgi:hypothetical protein
VNERERAECELLRSLSSEAAADWLMSTYPIETPEWGLAMKLLPHRSWKKKEQVRLARYYLQRLPYASAVVYRAFSAFMSVPALVRVVRERLPLSAAHGDLLLYYLEPVLREKARSQADIALVNELLAELSDATGRSGSGAR